MFETQQQIQAENQTREQAKIRAPVYPKFGFEEQANSLVA
jgi:hypothetical protein